MEHKTTRNADILGVIGIGMTRVDVFAVTRACVHAPNMRRSDVFELRSDNREIDFWYG